MSSTTAPTAATAPTGPIASAGPITSTRAIASAGPIAPAGPPLPVTPTIPLVGSGFGEALHEGLVRAAARMSPRPGHAPAMSPATALGSWETGAVLDRFTARLPTALAPAEAEVPALRTTLTEFARTALSRAADTTPAPTPTPIAPPAASPHQVAAAVALLLECALLHVLESGITHRESALPRAVAVVRRLGEVVRGSGEGMWSGDDGRGERRRLARQLHDELGGALSLARLSLDAASTCAPTSTSTSSSSSTRTGPTPSPAPRTPDASGAFAAHLATAQRALAEATRENQALIDGIRHRADLPPLREALEAFLAGPRPRAGRRVQTSVEVIGDEWTLSERHREETFLALREALRDRLARSGARRVDTVVRITRRWLYAKVTDDGQGPAAGSVGSADRARALRSLTGRVEDLGGRTGITSGTPTGTLLEIHLPLRRHL
ncbi:sensor histidine kinase [Streptomyces sp. NPDC059837]|uniref:sensor histidine kinase n=1 Tax=Streptomyces sp. NPDC059837 TaxID=3346968 RepID=UPI00365AD012